MPHVKPIVVAYDIHKSKIRYRALKIIKSWRIDGQKSVHECRLNTVQAQELYSQLIETIEEDTDELLMAWIEPHRPIIFRGLGVDIIKKDVFHIR